MKGALYGRAWQLGADVVTRGGVGVQQGDSSREGCTILQQLAACDCSHGWKALPSAARQALRCAHAGSAGWLVEGWQRRPHRTKSV